MSYIVAGLIGFLFIQGVLLALLFIRKQPHLPNVLMSLLILKFALLMMNLLLEASGIFLDFPMILFLTGPLVFLYIRKSRDRSSLKKQELLFFLPAVLILPVGMVVPPELLLIADDLWNLIFAIAAFYIGSHWRRQTLRGFSESPGVLFLLIPLLVSISSLLSGLDMIYFLSGQIIISDLFSILMSYAEASFIFIPAWFVLYREDYHVSRIIFKEENLGVKKGAEKIPVKYEKNHLEKEVIDLYYKKLTTRMENESLYEQSSLSIGHLSDLLCIPTAHLSQVINRKEGLNYFQYINKVRINKVCQLLEQDRDKNILEIMYEVGFNSKSTFNNAFRTQMGKTPGEYRKQIQKGTYQLK